MSQQVLQMKYHPAKKEVSFVREIAGKESVITGNSGSVLSKYINKKGQFVLQDHGNQLFRDILKAFDGEEEVNLAVTMTKKDYEDFLQMVEYFNESSDVKINPTQLAELPDMAKTYQVVKKHGLDSINILNSNRESFHKVNSDNDNVRKCIDNFAQEINEATKKIKEKIDSLEENSVNLCFSGPYSSGKSSLINSLIGYEILPTAIAPETAAMMTIRSPREDEKVRICFNIMDVVDSFSEVVWNDDNNNFDFVAGPSESDTRKVIQETINRCKGKKQHEQVKEILNALNKNEYIERVIDIWFPMDIDDEHVQFTIFDTPGTDSGVASHKRILKDALSEQTHSILVFVTCPNGLSAGGNKVLLEHLSEIDSKEDKSTIDIGRSIFVINYADTLNKEEDFKTLRLGEISNEDDEKKSGNKVITIKLGDKKVLFTTAKDGYFAAAKKNGIIEENDELLMQIDSTKICHDIFGKYYRYDRCASSEFSTNLLLDKCKEAYEKAQKESDIAQQMWVASGLFALEAEIKEYGMKYAAAVKTFSIIDGVDKALAKLNRNAQSIENKNKNDIKDVENEISTIRNAIASGIESAKKGKEIGKKDPLPESVVKSLHLDMESISNFVQKRAEEDVDDILLGFFQKMGKNIANKMGTDYSPIKTSWDSSKETRIEQVIKQVLKDYTEHFKKERKNLLEKMRDEFISDVKRSISENGELSSEAKDYILEIEAPEIDEFLGTSEFGEIYRANRLTEKKFLREKEYLDHESFIKDMNSKLRKITAELSDSYKEDYRNSLNNQLRLVESEFNLNMEKYSVSLKAKLEDKEAMEELRKKILVCVEELNRCQSDLNSVIWEVK